MLKTDFFFNIGLDDEPKSVYHMLDRSVTFLLIIISSRLNFMFYKKNYILNFFTLSEIMDEFYQTIKDEFFFHMNLK